MMRSSLLAFAAAASASVALGFVAGATAGSTASDTVGGIAAASGSRDLRAIEETLGVRIERLHLSAGGYMVDFRYRVLDPAKAAPLLDRQRSPLLVDEAGAQLAVPSAPRIGPLRPTGRNRVVAGRTYYILFANPGRYLKAGSEVTLVAGEHRIAPLVVE